MKNLNKNKEVVENVGLGWIVWIKWIKQTTLKEKMIVISGY